MREGGKNRGTKDTHEVEMLIRGDPRRLPVNVTVGCTGNNSPMKTPKRRGQKVTE